MPITFPPELVALQRACDAAWAELEAFRKRVDAQRAADTPDVKGRPQWVACPLRPWTAEEDTEIEQLATAARVAQTALRAGLHASGLGHGTEVVQGLKKAARDGV